MLRRIITIARQRPLQTMVGTSLIGISTVSGIGSLQLPPDHPFDIAIKYHIIEASVTVVIIGAAVIIF